MRMPEKDEDLVGKVCVCSVGRIAVVTHKGTINDIGDKPLWMGIGLDGLGTWASSGPAVAAETLKEFHNRITDRFGGKMSWNA